MSGYRAALAAEALKMRRSWVPWLATGGLTMAPVVCGLFQFILEDPERAQRMGLLGQKAQLAAGAASWEGFLSMLAQAMAVGGLLVFSVVTSWVFGREFADRTVRTLLALPTSREAIVLAKGSVVLIWCGLTSLWLLMLGAGIGAWMGLPGGSPSIFLQGAGAAAAAALLTASLQSVTALAASAGRGYLAPIGGTLVCLTLANLLSVLGYGRCFPWAIPGLLAGAAGSGAEIGAASIALLSATAALGAAGTVSWWRRADQAS